MLGAQNAKKSNVEYVNTNVLCVKRKKLGGEEIVNVLCVIMNNFTLSLYYVFV